MINNSLPKFIIIGPDTENTQDLLEEIRHRHSEVNLISLKDICFKFSENKFIAKWNNFYLDSFDIFIFRGYNKNLLFAKILANHLLEQNKIVLDTIVGKNSLSGKVAQAFIFSQKNISHPKTYQAVSFSAYKKLLSDIPFPIIVKPVDGQKGQGIEKFNDKKSALAFFYKHTKDLLIQEYLPITSDIRVFIVAGKVLGGIRRMIIQGDYRSNASLGAIAEKIQLTPEMENLALQAAAAMDYEIAGVDLIENNGKLYVLEVNIAPQWQKFKEVTGINPARDIVDLAIKRYLKTNPVVLDK